MSEAACWIIVPAAPWGGSTAVFGPFTPYTAEAEFGRLKDLAGGVVTPVLVTEAAPGSLAPNSHEVHNVAERLFAERMRARGWTDADLESLGGYSLQQAVARIAAGGEEAAVRNAIGARTIASHMISPSLIRTCMDVIRDARGAA